MSPTSGLRLELLEALRDLSAFDSVGMVLLTRLAVDRHEQGTGLGGTLLAEGLRKAVAAGETAAARLVVVDALDENAALFYERFGFIAVPEHRLRLYRRMKDVRTSLDASQTR
ncbi:MAG: GNAT family N-acetyltransferase [Acidimicrobiales bacterium]